MGFWTAVFTLFLVLDPLGNLPVALALLDRVDPKRRQRVMIREGLFALGFLLAFLFAGPVFLRLMGVSTDDVRIAGGVVLFVIALRMIFPRPGANLTDDEEDGEPFIVPLAIPLLAGPSALAAVILMRTQMAADGAHGTGTALAAVLVAWGLSFSIMVMAPAISNFLGHRTMRAIERLSGMLLIVISVHLVMSGIMIYLRSV
jgi:multiple antibiotic resistance protein